MRVKICGLTRPGDVEAACRAGAHYLGFVFFPKSPRHVSLDQAAALMPLAVGRRKVALVVNPDDALIETLGTLPLDFLQLHGAESPERVAEIKALSGLPAIKALGVSDRADLARIADYAGIADQILLDAKPPKGATRPGGNALAFDWTILKDHEWRMPWLLAGGLTVDNVASAVRLTGATQVDVSSGVESAPGLKDPGLIARFIDAATGAEAETA